MLKRKNGQFEIAIVGCSVGMEVHSYAMVCETNGFANYRVDGYDVHADRLEAGARGVYHLLWGTEIALTDPRIRRGLAYTRKGEYGAEVVIHEKVISRARFLHHDISKLPLPQAYDILVCTNVLHQTQAGGLENAVKNLVRGLKHGGILIQNYGKLGDVNVSLVERVNLKLQKELGLPV